MNSIQESKISMYLGTCDLFNTNASIVNQLPNFQGYFTTLKTSIISIQNFGEFQNFDKTGLAITKKQARLTLSLLAADTARKLTALAAFTNNQVLLNEMNYSDSDFKRCTDAQLRDVAQGTYNRAQTNLTALAPCGATAATQTSLQTAITNFVTAIPKPRVGIAEKKQSTLQLQNYFKIADNALANIDIIINLIKLTQPNFYSNYKTIRKIVNTSTGSLILKGLVTDVETGEPIKGAIVEFSLDFDLRCVIKISNVTKLVDEYEVTIRTRGQYPPAPPQSPGNRGF